VIVSVELRPEVVHSFRPAVSDLSGGRVLGQRERLSHKTSQVVRNDPEHCVIASKKPYSENAKPFLAAPFSQGAIDEIFEAEQ